jgi:hypothetical protein
MRPPAPDILEAIQELFIAHPVCGCRHFNLYRGAADARAIFIILILKGIPGHHITISGY